MIIYSGKITPRLQYIVSFLGNVLLQQGIQLTSDTQTYLQYQGPRINYSNTSIAADEFMLNPHPLLFEEKIQTQTISCFEFDRVKAFFPTKGDLGFDLLAASFYLLSRYEEYLPHEKDMYGRYAHENSIAFKEKFLSLPLINNWIELFRNKLQQKFPAINFKKHQFSFIPTYDIDIAWSYQHKSGWRNFGGWCRSILSGEWKSAGERIRVLRGKTKDPFDSYSWLNQLHEKRKLKPYYFFLLAGKTGRYDKNISPDKKVMKDLIGDHLIRYPIGIHPSWQSGDDKKLLQQEISTLASITGAEVLSSRQHYIRMNLPHTYRLLLDQGIRFDFSMGYGSINGFRASVASPFFWYDLENEKQTELLLFPFCYMEANSFYEQKLSPAQAYEEMKHYYQQVKAVNGHLFTIWHNHFLGTDPKFAGWKEVYQRLVEEIV